MGTPGCIEIVNLDCKQGTLDVLLDQEHAALKSLLFPLLSVEMIETYMTEVIQDGEYGRIAAFEHGDVVLIY